MPQKLTLDLFLKKAKERHGDKYIYDKSVYINVDKKLTITCPIHGDFEQTPYSHYKGAGCQKCGFLVLGNYRKVTFNDFLNRAKEKHGDKYDYSKSNYIDTNTKITITCPDHGDFLQVPEKHMSGQGCNKCKFVKLSEIYRLDLDEFIKRSNTKHNNKYDYSKSVYANGRTNIIITCPIHGDFEQQPANHLNGSNCPSCEGKAPVTTNIFTNKAKQIHGEKYNYYLDDIPNTKVKIKIHCPKHGDFEQNVNNHLNGAGCPKCSRSRGESFIQLVLDKYKIPYKPEHRLPPNRCKYDFYLPEHNLLIEFHGLQHYQFVEFFHKDQEDFLYKKERDRFKLELARMHRIPIIYFNYKHLEMETEDFENLIVRVLEKIKNRKFKRWFSYEY